MGNWAPTVNLTTYEYKRAQEGLSSSPWFRLQTLVGLFICAGLPYIVSIVIRRLPYDRDPPSLNTLIGATLAVMLGIYFSRRLTYFPGTRQRESVLPAFLLSFGVVAVALLLWRLDYSRIQLATSAIMSILFFSLPNIFGRQWEQTTFHVVPVGAVGRLKRMAGVSFVTMAQPALPDRANAAIVADFRASIPPEWERTLAQAALQGYPVYHVKQLVESLSGQVKIEHLSENSLGSLIPNLGYRKIKSLVDVIAALVVLPFVLVILVPCAIAIRLDSPGPVFFRQKRMGFRGKVFTVIKFRTMAWHTEPTAGDARNAAVTQDGDTRITRVGSILRKFRLDELPQIFNILRGEMSWIGPRPEAVQLSQWYEDELPFYSYRHIVLPGITGWAQVNQGHVADLEAVGTKLQFDFYYIKYFSAWLDILITLKTVRTMLTGFGAK